MGKVYQITEYSSFVSERELLGYVTLPRRTFEQLESFILSSKSKGTGALELMGLSAKKGVGKVITAKNYVGIINMNDGTIIEILPKIYSKQETLKDDSRVIAQTKKLVIEMLKTLHDSPYKSLQIAHMDTERMNILEVFIRMFIDEVFTIVKRGIKCDYEAVENNEQMFRGKLKVAEHIKHNYAHKERSYVQFDEYNSNRPENRLLKTALLYLYKCSNSVKNKGDIKTLLNEFSGIEPSLHIEFDFSKVKLDRNMKDYQAPLLWCKVFLMGKSFTSFSGSEVAIAILFPMETLFENYIATQLLKLMDKVEYSVLLQDRAYHLFDKPDKRFLIKPDIVVKRKGNEAIFILDTKWKVLTPVRPNNGIAQSDMYQMFAYQKKYGAQSVILLYPLATDILADKNIQYTSDDGVIIKVRFVDMFDLKNSLIKIVEEFEM